MDERIEEQIQGYGLTLEQYEECLSDAYAKANHLVDMDWQEIIDKYNLNIHYDTLRKATQTIFGGAFVSEYYKSKYAEDNPDGSYLEQINIAKQELRKEKQKMSDERAAYNKSMRNQGRIENDLEFMKKLIQEKSYFRLPPSQTPTISSDNDLVICISDFHLGLENDTFFGKFDTDIATKRLSTYLQRIYEIQNINHSENAYVLLLGDLISGDIHFTVQLENRENVIEQVQKSAELISSFVYELSKHFSNVYINGVAGNHSRTSLKDQVLRGSRLDDIIPWYMKAALQHIENVKFIDENNYDSTIGTITVRGHEYLLVHGDWDSFNTSGVSKLVMMLGFKPTGIFYGHLHKCSLDDVSGVTIIRSGSFAGTGDDNCVSKRIYGTASQMVTVVNNQGIYACYPVSL